VVSFTRSEERALGTYYIGRLVDLMDGLDVVALQESNPGCLTSYPVSVLTKLSWHM